LFVCAGCVRSRRADACTCARRSLQPVRDTRERQVALWKEFILDFCRAHKVCCEHRKNGPFQRS
jgi:hypothetical protein